MKKKVQLKKKTESTQLKEDDIKKNIKDREWRLNNLYWIRDEKGRRIKFKLNWAQELLLENLWYLNIILKARQLGVTSFFCILYLDDVVFKGLDAGLIAHTLADASKIFDTKVKYAWDNLPESIKGQYELNTDNARELKFKLGKKESSFYVGTSLRSQTCQRLHISEMGTIDQRNPGKSEEIKSGALNTVHVGQIVTIESTSKGAMGNFYNLCEGAMATKKSGKELTEMDYKFFFLPWYQNPEYSLKADDIVIPIENQEYFNKIEVEEGVKLTIEQKNWYYKKSLVQKDSMKSEFPSTAAEAFLVNIEGAYYGKEMDRVLETKRITSVPYDPRIPVDTWWDLGTNKAKKDSNSIIFTQDVGLEIHIIDFYGNSGEGLAHYIKVLNEKPYVYGIHWGPHDLEVKELGTGKTRMEVANDLGLKFRVVPDIGFSDGIEATRIVLQKCWFDEEKTAGLTRALRMYRKEWDLNLGRFKDQALKDWACDPADAMRMMAVGHRDVRRLGIYDEEEEEMRRIKEKDNQMGKWNPFNPFEL